MIGSPRCAEQKSAGKIISNDVVVGLSPKIGLDGASILQSISRIGGVRFLMSRENYFLLFQYEFKFLLFSLGTVLGEGYKASP